MTVSETVLPDGGYEQRYTVHILGHPMKFVRRPVSIPPEEGMVCFVDNGAWRGAVSRQSAAVFQDGKFKRCKFEPTHWTTHDD